jgi:hypothetical protein
MLKITQWLNDRLDVDQTFRKFLEGKSLGIHPYLASNGDRKAGPWADRAATAVRVVGRHDNDHGP